MKLSIIIGFVCLINSIIFGLILYFNFLSKEKLSFAIDFFFFVE